MTSSWRFSEWWPSMSALPYPFPLSDFLPEPVAPLILIDCEHCQGETECAHCGGSGKVEVCGSCLERPEMVCGVEACSCTFPLAATSTCEVCEQPADTTEGLCRSCFRKGMDEALREEDPELFRYYELRDFDLPRSVIEQEMAIAKEYGWI